MLFRRTWDNAPTVIEGKACSVINAAMFLGQIIASLLVGPIVDLMEDNNYFIVISCVAISIMFLLGVFIRTPKPY